MKASILGKLESIEERHLEISALLADAETIAEQDRYRQLSLEYAQLMARVNHYRGYRQAREDVLSAREMLADPDPDMEHMAEDELKWANERIAQLEKRTADLPGLHFTGNAFGGVGMPFCIHKAEQAAEKVLEEL